MTNWSVCALAIGTLAAAPLAYAQSVAPAPFSATSLNLSATGEVRTAPDMATLSLGVQSTAPTAAAAMSGNAAQMDRILATLKGEGLTARDIQTSRLTLNPQYVYQQGQPPRLTGYQASNTLTIDEHDLDHLGRLVDEAVAAGATNVDQISFGLADPSEVKNEARVKAVHALEAKAQLYANAAGYRLGRLVNLTEESAAEPSPPRPMMAVAVRAEPSTPVEAGEIGVKVDVSGVFELTK